MKKIINYYFGLYPDQIINNYDSYFFKCNNKYYSLYEVKNIDTINDVYELSNSIFNNGIKTYRIIPTNDNNLFIYFNNRYYALLGIEENYNEKINLMDIINFLNININYDNKKYIDWKYLWINKNNNLEYQFKINENKYKNIKKEFYYYQGLSYLAISLIDKIKVKNISIQHRRVNKDTIKYEYYNPFNYIYDDRVRDLANYYKSNEYDLKIVNIYPEEWLNFFIRYIYPTEFYDKFENDNLDVESINSNVNRIKKTYNLIRNICLLPNIEWIMQH